ncbi:MAG: beta-propeller fold lactonase family protein [Pseudomonadota bacterium]|nr:beta-propeller fold lactonase family protein [Pseudomonadota bacterium]
MKIRNTARSLALSAACCMGIGISASHTLASVGGSGTANGDAWQGGLEQVLKLQFVADFIGQRGNVEPFLIPQAKSHAITTFRNQAIDIDFRAKHLTPEGEPDNNLSWAIAEAPLHGRLEGTLPNVRYIPDSDYTGYDRIVFNVSDNLDGDTNGTIDIKVQGSYTNFESGQVRPLALNSDKTRLYALNTPDGKLEIFDVSGDAPALLHSVPVGLEPVAIALRNDDEAWVVNHLSDNVSVVKLNGDLPYVKKTLHVGDEPQDIVFAGRNNARAFITTAHRGQHSTSDLDAMTPGTDRADVWVFDTPDAEMEKVITLFGMAPRGLAVTPDGETVYAAIYKSGNQTTTAAHNYRLWGKTSTINGKPGPNTDADGILAPNTGVIVKYDGEHWRDVYGTKWDHQIYFELPDYDVFKIDATARSPRATGEYSGVGNALFNMAVNPVNGNVYVSNMDARNELQYEGHGHRSDKQTLRGRFIKNQITVIKDGEVIPRELNSHLSDSNPDGSPSENERSLAMPLEIVVDSTGETLYVAAYSSSKIGVFNTRELENGTFTPSAANHIEVSGGGPAGIALDEDRDRLYVLTRFNNSVAVIDLNERRETQSVAMYNPEPEYITEGRPFLYDARFSSGRGDSSCGSCHLFGDMDGLAWELGNPDGVTTENPRGYVNFFMEMNALPIHHPLKGPMLTQSFRGMDFQGPLHWRGDKTGAYRVEGESLEHAAFKEFRGAFTELLGRAEVPSEEEMNKFADFVLQMRYPPNPNRNLDDTLTPAAQYGADIYFNQKTTGFKAENTGNVAMITCNDCHEVDPEIERFGTSTLMSFEGTETTQDMKVAHLRNVYSRVGMFGLKLRERTSTAKDMGDQVTGYGLSHDGAIDTLENFLSLNVFHVDTPDIPQVMEFVTQMPTGLAPIVGQQATLNFSSQSDVDLIETMMDQALAHTRDTSIRKQKCDLIAHGVLGGEAQSWRYTLAGDFVDMEGNRSSFNRLRWNSFLPGNSITFTCAAPGSGERLAFDRDEDGLYDQFDAETNGRLYTSVQAPDPDAEPVQVERAEGAFWREEAQKNSGIFPDFDHFWAFDFFN